MFIARALIQKSQARFYFGWKFMDISLRTEQSLYEGFLKPFSPTLRNSYFAESIIFKHHNERGNQ